MCPPNNLSTTLAYFWDLPFLHVAIEFVNTHGGPFLILTVSCGVLVLQLAEINAAAIASAKQPSTSSCLMGVIESRFFLTCFLKYFFNPCSSIIKNPI